MFLILNLFMILIIIPVSSSPRPWPGPCWSSSRCRWPCINKVGINNHILKNNNTIFRYIDLIVGVVVVVALALALRLLANKNFNSCETFGDPHDDVVLGVVLKDRHQAPPLRPWPSSASSPR